MKTNNVLQALLAVMMLSVLSYSKTLTFPKEVHKKEQAISPDKVRLIFYADKGDTKHVATIKIQDRVVGSLPPKHYTEALVCKEKVRAGVADRGKIVKPTRYYDASFNDENIKNIYYKIDETSDRYYAMTPVDEKTALDALSKIDTKSHIINRYIPNCTSSDGNKTN
ncbi:MAG: hypothetical protein M0Q90_17290 [Bacteroidales bacterium]|nr:hypothetical protein [Bacteroidales bacterium]